LENSKLDGKNCYADEPRSIPQKISHFVGWKQHRTSNRSLDTWRRGIYTSSHCTFFDFILVRKKKEKSD
jgi:hypothetical protein